MKLESIAGYPTTHSENGFPTNLAWNLTPTGTYQIARVLDDGHEVLFEGSRYDCQLFLDQEIEQDLPGLITQR